MRGQRRTASEAELTVTPPSTASYNPAVLRLYYHPASTYARRVRMTLLEKRIEFEPVVLDMVARAHKTPEYLALNPYGRVPTIDDDGFVLYESSAILTYLEATRPLPALTPPDARGRAQVDMHLRLCDLQMARPTGQIIFPKRFMPPERWDRAAMAQARAEIGKHLAIVEQTLGDRPYLVGDAYTLADIAYAPFLQFLPLTEVEPPPRVTAWRDRLLERPSAVATAPER
jgi:glutathione S-transferase